ncbi:phosphodiesterase [Pseudodesulfovibrio senegalensis]|jgi:hypothetical protein|uniref:Phosphoesterase n=1 Tax=Pseudodesulfovibrio senegalensis TaxID=1721087 RepID=A0A6N6N5S9_9BACT|nr:phosphodiesterase [Pseudodesulfovibrio senegalensis]KAB1443101.1 phosphodiesterase [Pseudodesulfovibrio senegalensis]
MKILFIGDLHGNAPRTRQLLDIADTANVDMIALLGDILYHGPRNPLTEGYDPKATAQMLNRYKQKIVSVRGNCDSEVDQTLLEFPMTCDFAWLVADGKRMFLTHGHLWSPSNLPPLMPGDVFASGHVHFPSARVENGIHIWNPGCPCLPKEGSVAGYGLYENGVFRAMDMDGNTVLEDRLFPATMTEQKTA